MRTTVVAIDIVTDGDQVGSASVGPFTGLLQSIEYVKDGSTPYADGVAFTITSSRSLYTLWTEQNVNASKLCCPRLPVHSQAGVASTYDGTEPVLAEHISLQDERVLLGVAAGGIAKTGRFIVRVLTD